MQDDTSHQFPYQAPLRILASKTKADTCYITDVSIIYTNESRDFKTASGTKMHEECKMQQKKAALYYAAWKYVPQFKIVALLNIFQKER